MPSLSPSTVAINTIAQCLSNAANAASYLDAVISQDLRSLLRLAGCEADRVRNANRKAAAAAKRAVAGEPAKKSARRGRKPAAQAVAEAAPQAEAEAAPQPKSRRRKAAANGVAAH